MEMFCFSCWRQVSEQINEIFEGQNLKPLHIVVLDIDKFSALIRVLILSGSRY